MGIALCRESDIFDFRDLCVRSSWSTLCPAIFVLTICLFSLPLPPPVRKLFRKLTAPFDTYLTLHEAEALDINAAAGDTVAGDEDSPILGDVIVPQTMPLWRTSVLVLLGLAEALCWIAYGSYTLINDSTDIWSGVRPFLVAGTWLYSAIRFIVRPTATPPYDLFVLYSIDFIAEILQLGGLGFDRHVYGTHWPPALVIIGHLLHLTTICVLLVVVLRMPLEIPSTRVKQSEIGYSISPEDYTALWKWITFSWVYPLIKLGRNTTLNEKDVWYLSPTIQSRPIFIKFAAIQRSTLLRKILATNSLDLLLDLILTLVSLVLQYTGPFFLKLILDAIDTENPTRESRARAYIYAFLAFISTLLKAQSDIHHLWFGRRAATRIRSELMAAIYDKSLKRKDYSGIIKKEMQKEDDITPGANGASTSQQSSKDKKKEDQAKAAKAAKADDPKAGADVGKIVNLMAGDANRVSQTTTAIFMLYSAPFEILIAGTFLYQLLGWSAFAGFVVLLAGWPLNSMVAKTSIRIQKGSLAARDKRMSVLNELLGGVKFIKFFAWEERWIDRTMSAREKEMEWIVKARANTAMFYLLWSCGPVFVSVIAFFAYVMQGKELTIGTAFTSIALFNMIRKPLNAIPAYVIQTIQTGIALNRISVYLDEDEVTEQVSSLKRDVSRPISVESAHDKGLGLENASFKWNEVEESIGGKDKLPDNRPVSSTFSTAETTTLLEEPSEGAENTLPADHHFELHDLSVRFPEGELSVITGPTASGKTALLTALLGEMTLLSGKITMSKNPSLVDENGLMHSISYAAQSPWLRHQSIKDNILFGYPYDETRYEAVIECCALKPDLELLEDGDSTEIGARGVSLSGGQKARVALARAIYARTKYVLLDDPLSAVDSHTSRFLYERLLRGPLLANRTVVLVTHHVELVLPGAHYLVRMLDGRIDTQGTIKDLQAEGVLEEIKHEAAVEVQKEELSAPDISSADIVDEINGKALKKPKKLVEDEHREEGGVKWSIYKSYLEASSYQIWIFLAILVVITEILGVSEKVWIMIWGEGYKSEDAPASYLFRSFSVSEKGPRENVYPYSTVFQGVFTTTGSFGIDWPSAIKHPLFYVGVYTAIGLVNALTSVFSVYAQYTGALRASRILFKKLLVTVVRATFRFHDTTPQGRMLNRFGKDIETIDLSLASSLQEVNASLANFFVSIITVSVVFPEFLLPAIILGLAYRELAIGYLNTGRDLRRMESNTRSPIFSDFGELLEGIVTIRAFSAERRFLDNLHKKIDTTTQMWYAFWMTNRWLLLNFDTLGAFGVLITSLFSISALNNRGAGMAGICITSAMAFTMSVYWACRFWTILELDLNSVERVVEYLDLPQEPPAIIDSNRVPAYWPSSSANNTLIAVENLVVKYAPDLPSVIQDVSFTLKAGERVGLLGRTGSGKSTLAMSMLRFVDPASGRILIDGIDISTIGIHDLRSRLTFIPQDATLFSGTLRENLDPFNEHTDSECLDVLQRVHMINGSAAGSRHASVPPSRTASVHNVSLDDAASTVTAATDVDTKTTVSLETQVSAGGNNFSQGQRQLIALARALLRRSAIIVLDEATSSIDFATDAKIQTAIREEFAGSLLLTVAHRLRTVIDYDRLVVLDKGQVAEFDTPWKLIQKENGIFRNMCLKSGSFGELEAVARSAAVARGDDNL